MSRNRARIHARGIPAAWLPAACALLGSVAAAAPQIADEAAAPAVHPASDVAALLDQVNAELRLIQSELVFFDAHPNVGEAQLMQFPLDGALYTLELVPHSVRDPQHYQVLLQLDDGSYIEAPPEPVRTLRGSLLEIGGSAAAAALFDDGLYGTLLLPDGVQYWFEPLVGRFAGALPGDYVLYRSSDALGAPGRCGNEEGTPLAGDDEPFDVGGDDGGIAGTTLCTAQLACDTDFEYYQSYGSSQTNVQNRINAVVNAINVQYTNQTDITHTITTIIVRTSSADPYTSSDSTTLLTQFRNEWLANQTGVVRDVAKLFTARSINGGVIGQAWAIGGICTSSGYCFSWSDCCGSFGCATDLCAHELGHLWNATHCTCSSPPFTMNPFITCANNFNAGSISQIVAYRNTRTCLDCSGTGGPANNACASATAIGNGSFAFDTTGATTDGPDEPTACNFFSYTQVGNDIWYRYTASCTGTVTVNLCTASYDTKVAVYGSACPTTASAIACNDDACGTSGTRSQLTFASTAGAQYLIRIGGFNGATGTGTLTLSCAPSGPANDACAAATPIGNGSFAFSTVGATTDGPDEPGACNFAGYTQVGNDVWFRYTANSCGGTVTVSLCDATYDSKVAVYAGGTCPTAAAALACNDDACGTSNLRSTLTFPATGGGVYLIRIGGFNALTGSGTLTVSSSGNPPTINIHPLSQGACVGDAVSLSVLASGTGSLSYQWRRNAVNISGATSPTYTINPVSAGSAGSYDCVVTDACGSTTSNAATLTVNSGPTINTSPANQTVCEGQPASFTVVASGSAPLSYQWQRNTIDIGGATSATYAIPAATPGHAGSYRCVVSNDCGSATSAAATLTVHVGPTINTPPASETVCVGDSASFTVVAVGTAPLSYQWQKDTVNIGGATSATYAIASAASGDAGSYRCVVSNGCGSTTSAAATLTVNTPPTIATPPADQSVCVGDSASFTVVASGTAPLSYQWQKDAVNIGGATGATYAIASAASGDAGSYRCVVSNVCGDATSAAATLTVNVCGCPGERGDADCSGVVDFFDIDPFLTALFAPGDYQAGFCGGSFCTVDIDCSGVVDFFDIDPFLVCLFATCPACP